MTLSYQFKFNPKYNHFASGHFGDFFPLRLYYNSIIINNSIEDNLNNEGYFVFNILDNNFNKMNNNDFIDYLYLSDVLLDFNQPDIIINNDCIVKEKKIDDKEEIEPIFINNENRIDFSIYHDKNKKLLLYNKKSKEFKTIENISFDENIDFQIYLNIDKKNYYQPTVHNLRLRTSDNLESKIIRNLKEYELIEVIQIGKVDTINDINGKWVEIKTIYGETGYCFDGYLKKIK